MEKGPYVPKNDCGPTYADNFVRDLGEVIDQFASPGLKEKFKNKECSILDVGTGRGVLVGMLQKNGFKKAVGVEYSAHSPAPGARGNLARGDAEALPFGDAGLDVVVSHGLLDDMQYRIDVKKILTEIARVLKSGGIYYTEDLYAYWIPTEYFSDQFDVIETAGVLRALIKK